MKLLKPFQEVFIMNRLDPTQFHFHYQDNPEAEDEKALFDGINEYAFLQRKVEKPIKSFAIFIKDYNNFVLGGITGTSYYGCLYIDMLWLKEELRFQGFGKKLMEEADKKRKIICRSYATDPPRAFI
jgi:hypothetical protein